MSTIITEPATAGTAETQTVEDFKDAPVTQGVEDIKNG